MTESTRDQLIGFIGTGNIGNPMARQLIRGGHQLVVFDLRPEVMENLLELGAEPASSAAEVASRCSIVFTSLPGPPQVDAATNGRDGILAGAQPGDIHVDLSTNAPTEVRRILKIGGLYRIVPTLCRYNPLSQPRERRSTSCLNAKTCESPRRPRR